MISLNYRHWYHLLKLILISLESLNQESNKTKNPIDKINLQNYNTEHCTTEAAKGCVLLYIKDHIIYKLSKDLKIYKRKYL